MTPIRAQRVRSHVGHKWVCVVVAVCAARALRTARFCCPSVMRLISAALAPVVIVLRQAGRSRASVSHVLVVSPSFLTCV